MNPRENPVAGVTEFCKFNDHQMCSNPKCSCDCHRPQEPSPAIPSAISDPNESKQCPKCLVKRPAFERFCRQCGSKLGSLQCMACSAIGEPEDKFCYQCGMPMKPGEKVYKHVVAPTLTPPELDPRTIENIHNLGVGPEANVANEQEVLRALQNVEHELAKQQIGGDQEKSWSLPQGSFKITSKKPQAGQERQKGPFNPHVK